MEWVVILGIAIIVGLIIIFSIIDWSKAKVKTPPLTATSTATVASNIPPVDIPPITQVEVETQRDIKHVDTYQHPVHVQPPIEYLREIPAEHIPEIINRNINVPVVHNRLRVAEPMGIILDGNIIVDNLPAINQGTQPMVVAQPQLVPISQATPVTISLQPEITPQPAPAPVPQPTPAPKPQPQPQPTPTPAPQPQPAPGQQPTPPASQAAIIISKHAAVDIKSGPSTDNSSARTGCSGSFDFRSASTPRANNNMMQYSDTASGSAKSSPIVSIGIRPFIKQQKREINNNQPRSSIKAHDAKYNRLERVIDACSFSDSIITLLNNGTIIRKPESSDFSTDISTTSSKGSKTIRIQNNIPGIIRLEPFNGYLFALAGGKLYKLNNVSYRSNNWTWDACSWAPSNITHTSSTHDGNHLWLQNTTDGYLFNQALSKVHHPLAKGAVKRIYGLDHTIYLDIEQDTCVAHLTSKNRHTSYNNVCSALIDHEGAVIPIKASENNQYSDVRLINWEPYYIRK